MATYGRKLSHMPILARLGEIDYGKITLFLDSDMAECLGPISQPLPMRDPPWRLLLGRQAAELCHTVI